MGGETHPERNASASDRPGRGRTTGERLNVEFKDYVPIGQVAAELAPVFARFKAERLVGETFGDFCHRVGVEELAGAPAPA